MTEKFIHGVKFYVNSAYNGEKEPKLATQIYHYIYHEEIPLGSHVVVPAGESFRAHGPFSIGMIVPRDLNDHFYSKNATINIIDIIDDSWLRAEARRKEILAELKKRAAKMDDYERFAHLAKVDPDAAVMLQELAKLSGMCLAAPTHEPAPFTETTPRTRRKK